MWLSCVDYVIGGCAIAQQGTVGDVLPNVFVHSLAVILSFYERICASISLVS